MMRPSNKLPEVYLCREAVDFRKGINGLAVLVEDSLSLDPFSEILFVFCNRRRNRLKILGVDSSGVWVYAKRLDKGTFGWPESSKSTVELSYEELVMIIGGLDATRTRRRRWYGRG